MCIRDRYQRRVHGDIFFIYSKYFFFLHQILKSKIKQEMARSSSKEANKPAPPKRPLAPFFLYKQDVYEAVKKEHPESKITELTTIIAGKWKTVSEAQKKRYEEQHQEGKKKYEKEKKDYEDKYGKPDKKKKRGRDSGKRNKK
eukprot:TRINITY_DN1642_c0_g1_i1.p2 TRINITY_DN1642_c0_g1~~TRINITY_DN1642_c0_g1_i1.p2  ORF type:complete len:143 (+),score=54.68 TRINITY_DN1642_c0_g1_i1:77-505(+)